MGKSLTLLNGLLCFFIWITDELSKIGYYAFPRPFYNHKPSIKLDLRYLENLITRALP